MSGINWALFLGLGSLIGQNITQKGVDQMPGRHWHPRVYLDRYAPLHTRVTTIVDRSTCGPAAFLGGFGLENWTRGWMLYSVRGDMDRMKISS
jgi:hypothetical protein